jgi:hypothetical protein
MYQFGWELLRDGKERRERMHIQIKEEEEDMSEEIQEIKKYIAC